MGLVGRGERAVTHQQLQTLDKLIAVRVIESRVAASAMLHEHFASGIREKWRFADFGEVATFRSLAR